MKLTDLDNLVQFYITPTDALIEWSETEPRNLSLIANNNLFINTNTRGRCFTGTRHGGGTMYRNVLRSKFTSDKEYLTEHK